MHKKLKDCIKIAAPFKWRDDKLRFLIALQQRFYKSNQMICADITNAVIYHLFGCEISYKAIIGKDLKLPHPIGIVIGQGVIIKNNVTIYQNVTLGRRNELYPEYPTIENNVKIYTNSMVVGDITIGANSIIAAFSYVDKSVPVDSIVKGIPAAIKSRGVDIVI